LSFQKINGNCTVPLNVNKKLANWIKKQRQRRKLKQLSFEQIQKLDNIGFNWGNNFL
jgi:uncharacterized protein YjiS (DUF1127 family)